MPADAAARRSMRPHQQLGDAGHFVGGSRTPRRAAGEHLLVEIAARAVELVEGERRDDDAGRYGVDARPSRTPFHCLGHHALHVASFGQLVGVQRIANALRTQELQRQQLFGGRAGQLFVGLGRQRRHPVPGLAGDRHADAARADDPPDLFEQHRRAIEIDAQDRFDRGLARGYSRGVDQHGDIALAACRADHLPDRCAGGDVHLAGHGVVTGLRQLARGGPGVVRAAIADKDALAGGDVPDDRQTDPAGSGQQYDFFHRHRLFHDAKIIRNERNPPMEITVNATRITDFDGKARRRCGRRASECSRNRAGYRPMVSVMPPVNQAPGRGMPPMSQ